jgi:hypothetical protein
VFSHRAYCWFAGSRKNIHPLPVNLEIALFATKFGSPVNSIWLEISVCLHEAAVGHPHRFAIHAPCASQALNNGIKSAALPAEFPRLACSN